MSSRKVKIIIVVAVVLVVLVGVLFASNCSGKSEKGEKETSRVENVIETDKSTSKVTEKEDETTSKVDEETDNTETSDEATKDETTDNTTTENITTENITTESATTQVVATQGTTTQEATTKDTSTQETTSPSTPEVSLGDMRNITTAQVVHEMGIGINLGNTFESTGNWFDQTKVQNFETAWGSPVITKEMIQGMANEGFGVLRIPVAWSNMMNSDYTIAPEYINRVKEVTGWAIDSGMYVIVNIHWDGGWWTNFPTDKENCMKKYKSIWTQLSAAFGQYGDKLMFESLNEEGCWDSVWNRYGGTSGKAEAYGLLNEINQTFVDVVRGSGGNNAYRHLLIAGYATDITNTCDSYFKMPNDPQGRCAVSVHYYNPFGYTHLEKDESWAKVQTEWGSDADKAELKKYMKMMYDNFASKGVPVIIGEFGVPTMSNKSKDNVVLYLKSVAEAAYDYGMCPVLWDTTSNYSYYNRYTCSMSEYPSLKEAFADILR